MSRGCKRYEEAYLRASDGYFMNIYKHNRCPDERARPLFSAPIAEPHGEFLGIVTTLVGMTTLEHVLTGTLLTFRQREGLLKALESQSLTGKEARVRHVC